MDDSDRLSALRRELQARLGAQRYELWLGPQTELLVDGATLRVGCSSATEAQWIRRHWHAALTACIAEVFGHELAIVYESPEGAVGVRRKPTRPALHSDSAPAGARQPAVVAGPPATANNAPRFTFADFVTTDANRLAVQSARDLAEQPGVFSPLVLHGGSGVGKSHLLQAIGQHARRRGRVRILHFTAEQFTTQFLEAMNSRTLAAFRQKTRQVDLLLVDDVQFLQSKKATLEELLYTIDAVQGRGGQVALTSDRPVGELQALNADLAARLSAGLAASLDPPDYIARIGILRAMAARMRMTLAEPVIECVAQQVVGSARLLSGAINRLVAVSMAQKAPITVELTRLALCEFCRQHAPHVRLQDIQQAVCDVFGVGSASLKSARKTRSVAEPRMLAMWLARRLTKAPLSEISDFFGRRSHSTVVSAQRKFDRLLAGRGQVTIEDQPCDVEEALRRIEVRLRTA